MIIFLRSFGVKIFCFILCSPKLSKLSNFLNTVVEIVVVFSMLPCYIFSSPELKAQVSFSDHLLSVVCLFICPSIRL